MNNPADHWRSRAGETTCPWPQATSLTGHHPSRKQAPMFSPRNGYWLTGTRELTELTNLNLFGEPGPNQDDDPLAAKGWDPDACERFAADRSWGPATMRVDITAGEHELLLAARALAAAQAVLDEARQAARAANRELDDAHETRDNAEDNFNDALDTMKVPHTI